MSKQIEAMKLAMEALKTCDVVDYQQDFDSKKVAKAITALQKTLAEQPAPAQPWVGLTDEEIIKCWGQVSGTRCGYVAFARAIEAKLKKKNTKGGA